MKFGWFFFLLPFFSVFAKAQDYSKDSLLLVEGDSLPTYGIPLKEVIVFQPLRFKNLEELNRYLILRRRVLRVYPYAKLAAERLTVLNERLDQIDSKRGKKKYLKRLEDFVYEEFEEEMFEDGIATISEVYDGDPPHKAGGAISQAWNVAELLRIRWLLDKPIAKTK